MPDNTPDSSHSTAPTPAATSATTKARGPPPCNGTAPTRPSIGPGVGDVPICALLIVIPCPRRARRRGAVLPQPDFGDPTGQIGRRQGRTCRSPPEHAPRPPTDPARAFVAYDSGTPAGRVLLTRYAGEPVLYLGFFESADDVAVSARLFAAAEQVAADAGATAVVGPVDASFWIRYRLKVSGFENAPYFSEPLNPPY